MQKEFQHQFAHIWKVFVRLVKDFNEKSWIHAGRKRLTPVRLSMHVLESTQYYLEDDSEIVFPSGKPSRGAWGDYTDNEFPTQVDILHIIESFSSKTSRWLSEMDYLALNETFPWAGETRLGVVIFLLCHSTYHLGELSALLNESKGGIVEDHYVLAGGEE